MVTFNKFLKFYLSFLAVSAEVNENEEDTKQMIMQFHKDREEFLKHFDPAEIGYRMHVNSTVNDNDEPSPRILCFAFLGKILHCGKALLGWGCGMCGWGCNVIGGILKIFKFIFRKRPQHPSRPTDINYITPRPHPLPSLGIFPGGFIWERIQINAAKMQQNCFIFTGCNIPDSKRHETHVGPSAGRRRVGRFGHRG